MSYTTDEALFLDQNTRRLLVGWCQEAISREDRIPTIAPEHQVFAEHARSKGWLSAKNGRVLGPGWKTAGTFLKR